MKGITVTTVAAVWPQTMCTEDAMRGFRENQARDPVALLRRLGQWDQMSPPMTPDHAYWKREIDALLALHPASAP